MSAYYICPVTEVDCEFVADFPTPVMIHGRKWGVHVRVRCKRCGLNGSEVVGVVPE